MSYIDDLNQAAAEALAASSSATDSAQIMFDVANGADNVTVTTDGGEVKTIAKAIKDIIDSIEAGVEAPQVEPQTLSGGQTTVTLSTMTTEGIALYIEGSREFDFTVTNDTDFELSQSFPDGTRIWIVKRDIEGTADSFTVNTSTGSQTLSNSLDQRGIWVEDLTALKAIPLAGLVANQDAEMTTTDRKGGFSWVTGDQSANVDNDPQEGLYVALNGDDGTNGAWKRKDLVRPKVSQFGSGTLAAESALTLFDDIEYTEDNSQEDVNVGLKNITFRNRSTVKISSNATNGFIFDRDDTRFGQRIIKNARIDGEDNLNVGGTAKTGIRDDGTLNAVYLNTFIRDCRYGIFQRRTMECGVFDALLQGNEVGLYLKSDVTDGGGNANNYYSPRFQANDVGILISNVSPFPLHNNGFHGGLLQGNKKHAIAAFKASTGSVENITFSGFHIEANNDQESSATVDGLTIPACIIYSDGAQLTLSDTKISETVSAIPAIKLENAAKLNLHNVVGFGSSAGTFVESDLTSRVYETGVCQLSGKRFNYESYGRPISITRSFTLGTNPLLVLDRSIPNSYSASTDPMAPSASITDATNDGIVSVNGRNTRQITFAASVGSTSSNRAVFSGISGDHNGETEYCSFLFKSSLAGSFAAGILSTGGYMTTFNVEADKWYRVVLTNDSINANSSSIYLWPEDSNAATVNVTGFMLDSSLGDGNAAHLYSTGGIDVISGSL